MRAVSSARRAAACLAACLVAAAALAPGAGAAEGDLGFPGPSTTSAGASPSGSKPESKLWWNDGIWWGSMWAGSGNGFRIFRLNPGTQTWTDTGVALDKRAGSRADVLWDAPSGKLYVASHLFAETSASGYPSYLYRLTYNPVTNTYSHDSGFPAKINNYKTETLAIAKDTTGTLWATWRQEDGTESAVYVNRTLGTDTLWDTPFRLPFPEARLTHSKRTDEISSVIAFGGATVGIMWSHQGANADFFAVHVDGAAKSAWSLETAYGGPGLADDHINLKTDVAGRVYAAVKTSRTGGEPLIVLLRRTPGGVWSNHVWGLGTDGNPTRPIVLVDESNSTLHVLATCPHPGSASAGSGGDICDKSSPLSSISFQSGKGAPVIRDADSADMNDVTSTKQNLTSATGLVAVASDNTTRLYWHAFDPLAAPPVPPANSVPPSISGTAQEGRTLTAQEGTWSGSPEPVYAYQWRRCNSSGGSCVNIGGATKKTYTAVAGDVGKTLRVVVTATNSANNASATSGATTVVQPPGGGDTTAPVFQSAEVNGPTLTLEYNEQLNGGSVPAATAFTVKVDGTNRSVADVAVNGAQVTLTLGTPVASGDSVTVSYAKPATNPIEDLAGNDAASLSGKAAANTTPGSSDTTPPSFQGATVNANALTLEYDEALNTSSAPAAGAFAVDVNGAAQPVEGVAIGATVVVLTLASSVAAGDTVTVSYAKPATNPIEDLAGNASASFSNQPVTNTTSGGGGGGELATFLPNGDGSRDAAIRDQAGGTSGLFRAIDDTIAGADDGSTYVRATGGASGRYFALLTDMPLDFTAMAALTIDIRARTLNRVDDSYTLFAQVFASDEATPLTAETAVAVNPGASNWQTIANVAFTGVVPGDEATWDGARLRLRWALTQVGSLDTIQLRLTAVELHGAQTGVP